MDYENRNNAQEMCMDWNDAIENDGQEFVTLEEGDYNFTVTGFERGRFPGSLKIPPCNKAAITIAVDNGGKTVNVKVSLRPDSFAYYDASVDGLSILPGNYKILYGSSSADEDLQELDFQVL